MDTYGRIPTQSLPLHLDPTERSPTPRDDTHHAGINLHLPSASTRRNTRHRVPPGHGDTDTDHNHRRMSIHGQMLSRIQKVGSLLALGVVVMALRAPL